MWNNGKKQNKSQRPAALADARDEKIRELALGLCGLLSQSDARRKLRNIRNSFATADRFNPEPAGEDRVTLWIKNFEIETGDRAKGLAGRFIELRLQPTDRPDHFKITLTRIERPLKDHPIRHRTYPNSGHPVLRQMVRKKVFKSREEAIAALDQLQREFPATTIRGSEEHLRTLVYRRVAPGSKENPTTSWLLYVEEVENGFLLAGTEGNAKSDGVAQPPRIDEVYPSVACYLALILGDEEEPASSDLSSDGSLPGESNDESLKEEL